MQEIRRSRLSILEDDAGGVMPAGSLLAQTFSYDELLAQLGDDRDYDGSDMIIISIAKYIFTKVWKEQ
jgi:hypothetical protein